MSKLPRISGKECIKALEKVDFYQKRRQSSHIIMGRDEPFTQFVVMVFIDLPNLPFYKSVLVYALIREHCKYSLDLL
jgi:predicted RNA binding protein YcfA (HicA-like mRNA interferase family)